MAFPTFGEGALIKLLDKARKLRDGAVNSKRFRKGTKSPKGSQIPNQSRNRKRIMDELT